MLLMLANNLNLLIATEIPGTAWGWEEVDAGLVCIDDKFWWCTIGMDGLSNLNGHVPPKLRPGHRS